MRLRCQANCADDVVFVLEDLSDDDVYYCICERLKLGGETKNMGV